METSSIVATPSPATRACPSCSGPVDVKSRHVNVSGSAVRIYCSEDCLLAASAPPRTQSTVPFEEEPRRLWPHVLGIFVGLALFAVLRGSPVEGAQELPAARIGAPAPSTPIVTAIPATPPDVAARMAEKLAEQQQQAAWVAELAKDTWFHPLAGPRRQMPHNHTQAFGAERPGERPAECVSGHCGVDVGAGLWGEPVHAAHDGVVDQVNRGPNEDHGGVYVRIAHRDATVFTWYFHLAAVPRWINPGSKVEAGQIIGLVGDTGVKSSAPHLHFAMTVKASQDAPARYLDPESLLAIWPLWIPDQSGTGLTRVSTHGPPGLPVRARGRGRKPATTVAPATEGQTTAAVDPAATAPAAAPAPTPAAP